MAPALQRYYVHSAVVAEKGEVAAVRGEGWLRDGVAGKDGRIGAEHCDPAFGVAGCDDRDVPVQYGECRVGSDRGRRVDDRDSRPSRVFGEYDDASGPRLAERRERVIAVCDGDRTGRTVCFRWGDEFAAGAVDLPVQQAGSGRRENVRFAVARAQYRDLVVDTRAAEIGPARAVVETHAHAAARVADGDQRPAILGRRSRRPAEVRERVLRRWNAEWSPSALAVFAEDSAGFPVLRDEDVRLGETG